MRDVSRALRFVVLLTRISYTIPETSNGPKPKGGIIRSEFSGQCLSVHLNDDGKEQLGLKDHTACQTENYWHWNGNLLKASWGRKRCLTCHKGRASLARCAGFFNQHWYVVENRLVCFDPDAFSDVSSNACLMVAPCAAGNCPSMETCTAHQRHRWSGTIIDEGPPVPGSSRVLVDVGTVVVTSFVGICLAVCVLVYWHCSCVLEQKKHLGDTESKSTQNSASRSMAFFKRHQVCKDSSRHSANQALRGRRCTTCGALPTEGARFCPACGQTFTPIQTYNSDEFTGEECMQKLGARSLVGRPWAVPKIKVASVPSYGFWSNASSNPFVKRSSVGKDRLSGMNLHMGSPRVMDDLSGVAAGMTDNVQQGILEL